MAENLYYNSKYHLINPNANTNGWLSSFATFKTFTPTGGVKYAQRPPYPILISNPTFGQICGNLNKSDVLLYLTVLSGGFVGSCYSLRGMTYLSKKLTFLHMHMHLFNIFALILALGCSHNRLVGMMDNGLRWKRKDRSLNKYDFTKDFEKHTIFKHFRERVDE
jgi:hypothetical protein